MRIAFDAKRAYHNHTGLGNYSRTLILDLAKSFPEHSYFLFNTKKSSRYTFDKDIFLQVLPQDLKSKLLPSLWRSQWMAKNLQDLEIDLFHGLSHEIPAGLKKSGIKSVVTIHDLIFERYPHQYNPLDVRIYRKKFKYACQNADRIIAISEQTKQDIVDFYKIDPLKIDVCYQSCDRSFNSFISEIQKTEIRKRYSLPERFFLSVGSIIERKNLLNICKAMKSLGERNNIPLVVVGKGGGEYRKKIDAFIKANGMHKQVYFLSDHYTDIADLPVIYSLAESLIYPSFFEGFGIPVLEALSVGTPVITSNASCLPEAGGDAALYVNPDQFEDIADCMLKVATDEGLAQTMIKKGFIQAGKFSNEICARKVMDTYLHVV